jgi:two-component system NarL family sensor kinase
MAAQRQDRAVRANGELGGPVRDSDGEDRLRRLLRRLITTHENERRRIAHDLHDQLGQRMSALHLQLEALRASPEHDDAWHKRFRDTQAYAIELDRELDRFTSALRPAALYDLGLAVALRDYVASWATATGITAEFRDLRAGTERCAPETETNLYRIAQEALSNVQQHAQALAVAVHLQSHDNVVVLTVEDDGTGFDLQEPVPATATGVIAMRERAELLGGRLDIETSSAGTTIIATVPCTAHAAVAGQLMRRGQ